MLTSNTVIAAVVAVTVVTAAASCGRVEEAGVLSGDTNERMLAAVRRYAAAGRHHLIVESRGGRESVALDIAEEIQRAKISLTVRGACTSACAQYLLPAATRIDVLPGAVIAVHINSAGILAYAPGTMPAEISDNVRRARKLYERNGVSSSFLKDATMAVQPICVEHTSTGSMRVYTRYDAWVPHMLRLSAYGLRLTSGAKREDSDARGRIARAYRQPDRVLVGRFVPTPVRTLTYCRLGQTSRGVPQNA